MRMEQSSIPVLITSADNKRRVVRNTQGIEGARYGWGNWFGEFEKALQP